MHENSEPLPLEQLRTLSQPPPPPEPFEADGLGMDDAVGAIVLPDLRPSVLPASAPVAVAARVNWFVVAVAVSISAVATAGTVGAVWSARRAPAVAPPPALPVTGAMAAAARVAPVACRASGPDVAAKRMGTAASSDGKHVAGPRVIARRSRAAGATAVGGEVSSVVWASEDPGVSCVQRCGPDVACILSCPYRGQAAGHGMVRATPSREQVLTGLRTVRGGVLLCGVGFAPTERKVDVAMTFDREGAVRAVRVPAPYAGTTAGECIEHAVRRARVPRFAMASFGVRYPFRLQ